MATQPAAAPDRVKELQALCKGKTHVYIDYANIRKACERLGWRTDVKKLKALLDAIGAVSQKFYFGTIPGDGASKGFIAKAGRVGFSVVTKPVKMITFRSMRLVSRLNPPTFLGILLMKL